jgi:hypothetical protein
MKLLSNGKTNAKIAKNPINSYIMHLSPHKENSHGKNVCGHASNGCASACLNTAGRGAFSNVRNARIKKTDYFFENKQEFLSTLSNELRKANNKPSAVRLNGTSDLDFIELLKLKLGVDVFTEMPNLKFYDYTKNLKRALKYLGTDYHLTFSRSETNDDECLEYLRAGGQVAVVFDKLPDTWHGFKVIDGDDDDLRYLDMGGVVIGLKAKGKAKYDTSGFVVKTIQDEFI